MVRILSPNGKLYNLKLEDKETDDGLTYDDIKNYLEFKDEIPVPVYNNFYGNFEKDRDYKKISIKKNK